MMIPARRLARDTNGEILRSRTSAFTTGLISLNARSVRQPMAALTLLATTDRIGGRALPPQEQVISECVGDGKC